MMRYPLLVLALIAGVMAAKSHAQTEEAENDFFESKIRPVLATRCYECHSAESGKSKGGLKVDSREALLRGGDNGPAVVGRSLEKSLLYQALSYSGDTQMPPKGKLPENIIADFRKWILMGAPDPRTTPTQPVVRTEIDIEKGRRFWAYQPVELRESAATTNSVWARTPIDRYVIAKLDAEKLQPVADASPRVIVRRLFFVLTGLPPSPEEMSHWRRRIETASTGAERQQVISELVDALLASPQFGERWGRHWMDVARFAESTGGDQNNVFQHAWRYRDWVIDAFNADKPYNDFVREQLAGDLLPVENDKEWADNVIATGFLAIGQKLVGEEDQQKYIADLVDEQIDATSRAFLGTSVACARCHDHKFDPIPQTDYYALAGIFRATETHYGLLKAQARQSTTLLDLTGLGPSAGVPTLSKQEFAALVQKRDAAREALDNAMRKIRSGDNVFRGALRRMRSDRDETEAALQAYLPDGRPRVFSMGTQDREFALTTRLLLRGEIDKPAQSVQRGVLQVLTPPGKHALPTSTKGSGRIELANWIVWRRNPLTARVMANRIWYWMTGRGLVRTVDDFGSTGDRPSHPELLDYLAVRFVTNKWSVKKLIREIAMSRTWQLSSSHHRSNFEIDPENKFLWRMNKRRLEGEAIRDAMLAVSGNLNPKRPVGTLLRKAGEGNVGQNVFEPVIRALEWNHRSVYLPRVRSVLPEMLELFDAPDGSLVAGARNTTASPLQSLYLMNNEFVQQQAESFAARVAKQPAAQRIDYANQLALGRIPSTRERQLADDFMNAVDGSKLTAQQKLTSYCQALLCTAEFCCID